MSRFAARHAFRPALVACATAVVLSACSDPAGHGASSVPAGVKATHRSAPTSATSTTGRTRSTDSPDSSDITDVTGSTTPYKNSVVSLAAVRKYAPGATISERIMSYAGMRRAYLVAVPHGAGTGRRKLPLIVVLHGSHSSVDLEAERTGLLPYVEQDRAITIYPVGYGESWNVGAGNCCDAAGKRGLDDVGFVTAATRDARSWLPVDAARTYLVGFSNGAKLAFDITCGHKAEFLAIATMGALPAPCRANKNPQPVSALVAIGSDDQELKADKPRQSVVSQLNAAGLAWSRRDGCAAGRSTSSRGIVTVSDYRRCSSGTSVRTVAYRGLTHQWPGTVRISGEADVDPHARLGGLVMAFFAQHHV